jgi:hypothetical protein
MKTLLLLCLTLLIGVCIGSAQWVEYPQIARYKNQRVEAFEWSEEKLTIYFGSGRKLTIRARQSKLLYQNK